MRSVHTLQEPDLRPADNKTKQSNFRHVVTIFLVFLAIYMLTWGGHYTSGDGAEKVEYAKSLWFRHTANLDVPPAVRFSRYGIGHPLLAIPFLAAAAFIRNAAGVHCESVLYTFLFVLNGALFVAMLAAYLIPLYGLYKTWATAALIGLCSTWWPYTKLDFSEPLVLSFLFAGFLLLRSRRTLLGMMVASVAFAIRPDAILQVALLLAWYVWRSGSWKSLPTLLASLLPVSAVTAYSNWVRWGTPFHAGYPGESFSEPFLVGLHGILFSGGKSIFLFSPPLILGIVALGRFLRTTHGRHDGWFFALSAASQILLFSRWWDWSGDDGWGVRFVVPGVMLMCIPLVEILERNILCIAFATIGFFVQLLGVLVGGLDYDLLTRKYELHRKALYMSGTNTIDFEDIRFNPRYGQLAGNWLIIQRNLGLKASGNPTSETLKTGTPLADAFSQADVARVGWDFIWLGKPHQPAKAH